MLEFLSNDNLSLIQKTDELKRLVSDPSFLNILEDPRAFLDTVIPFSMEIFKEFPPDSAMSFGQANDMRVFFIRLFSKFKYREYSNPTILKITYELIETENIFNRYLSLRILFPLLDSNIEIKDIKKHMDSILSFFVNELPSGDMDSSRYELGFFSVSDALNYLYLFQRKYSLPLEIYEDVFCSITTALRHYFTQKERLTVNKRISCEFCIMGINLIKFVNTVSFPPNHIMIAFISELCYVLTVISPQDCQSLRREVFSIILEVFLNRRELLFNLERYFLKNDGDLISLSFLSELIREFNKNITKIAYFEFDQRIIECIPFDKDLEVLNTCIMKFIINLSTALKCPMETTEIRMLIFKQIKNAQRIYKLLFLPFVSPSVFMHNCINNTNNTVSDPISTTVSPSVFMHNCINNTNTSNTNNNTNSNSNREEDEYNTDCKFMDYLKILIRSLSFLQQHCKLLERDQILTLGRLLLFPLTRNIPCKEYLAVFNELPIEILEKIIQCVIDDLLIKYSDQYESWEVLLTLPEINCIFIRAANQKILTILETELSSESSNNNNSIDRQICERLRRIFPVSYGFFKLDKKYIKTEFNEYFTVIFQYLLQISNYNYDTDGLNFRFVTDLINRMFLEVKSSEIAYTGLYFIYSHFEITVKELYLAYSLTFDPFYLECLFNIPVSLNLLVTKYNILLKPMMEGLRAGKKTREIVMKYIEYIIEFDNEEGLMDSLLFEIFEILKVSGCNEKGINAFSRISNIHRERLTNNMNNMERAIKDEVRCMIEIREENEVLFIEDSEYEKEKIEETLLRRIDEQKRTKMNSLKRVEISCPMFKSMNVPIMTGFDIFYEEGLDINHINHCNNNNSNIINTTINTTSNTININSRKRMKSRILRKNDVDLNSIGDDSQSKNLLLKTRDELINYFKELNDDKTMEEILFSFLLLDESLFPLEFLLSVLPKIIFLLPSVLPDGIVYASRNTFKLISSMHKVLESSIFLNIISRTLLCMINFIYREDFKSERIIKELKNILKYEEIILTEEMKKMLLNAFIFKLKNTNSFKIYKMVSSILNYLLIKNGPEFKFLLENSLLLLEKDPSDYLKTLLIEMSIMKNDFLIEDRGCMMQILQLHKSTLNKLINLPTLIETFLKNTERRDILSIRLYLSFLDKMKSPHSLFLDLLAPAKKYLPSIAVLEGFSNLESRRKFVENVNRNGNFPTQNSSSFRIFRNLFHNCTVSNTIKSNFIEVYNTQTREYRLMILDILMNSLEYDLTSFDFLINKLSELSLIKTDRMIGLSEEGEEVVNTIRERLNNSSLIVYLMEHMHIELVYEIVDLCIPLTIDSSSSNGGVNSNNNGVNSNNNGVNSNNNGVNSNNNGVSINNNSNTNNNNSNIINNSNNINNISNINVSQVFTGFLNEFLGNNNLYRDQIGFSKAAYNILRYLKRKKCRFNDNKAVLLVYRDLYTVEDEIEDLVNWYFKNFTAEDIELLYRIDSSFVITSECLLVKMETVENVNVRIWMIESFKRHLYHSSNNNGNNSSNINSCSNSNTFNNTTINNNTVAGRMILFYMKSKGIPIDDPSFINTYRKHIKSPYIPIELEEEEGEGFFYKGRRINMSEDYSEEYSSLPSESDISLTNSSSGDYSNESFHSLNSPIINNNFNVFDSIVLLFIDSLSDIIEMYCDLKIFSSILLKKCKENNPSIRYASLYYLSIFDPTPDLFESIFKLNFHERRYVQPALQTLVDRFGVDSFINPIKTVLRSEMRFKTTEYVLIPFICRNKEFIKNKEILFELSVFMHRLGCMGEINYELLSLIYNNSYNNNNINKGDDNINSSMDDSNINSSMDDSNRVPFNNNNKYTFNNNNINNNDGVDEGFMFDLNTIILQYEITNNKEELTKFNIYNRREIQKTKDPRIIRLVEEDFKNNFKYGCFDKEEIRRIFLNNINMSVSKEFIRWIEVEREEYLKSTLDNQMSLLELIIFDNNINSNNNSVNKDGVNITNNNSSINNNIINGNMSDDEILLKILSNLINNRYPSHSRFSSVLPFFISSFPQRMKTLFFSLILDSQFCYPPLYEALPSILEICGEEGIELVLRKPSNIHSDLPLLHIFKILPYSMEVLKKEFFSNLLSKDSLIRSSYLNLLFNSTPKNIMNLLQYFFTFNYSNLEEEQIEYFILTLLYNSLRPQYLTTSYLHQGSTDNCNYINCSNYSNCNNYSLYNNIMLLLFNKKCLLIHSLISGVFSVISHSNILYLSQLFLNCNLPFKIKIPFIKAFISVNVDINEIYYNPFNPNIKYYQVMDEDLYKGMIKSSGTLREIKEILHQSHNNINNSVIIINAYLSLIKKIELRNISYKQDDLDFIEYELRRLYSESGVDDQKLKNNGTGIYTIDFIESKLSKILETLSNPCIEDIKTVLNSSSLLLLIPRNSPLFSRLLIFYSICSEIIESSIIIKDNLIDSIYGRFRMWMIRYPSSLLDWNIFIRWRYFIFNKALSLVSELDKKKISSELCKLNCIYASKTFKEGFYNKTCSILNENTITTVEINQNMQRILLDLESLYNMGEYNTMVSVVTSLNIGKFNNEEKSRLYYWAYRGLKKMGKNESEKYGIMSRKLFDIIENKQEDLNILREKYNNNNNKDGLVDNNNNKGGLVDNNDKLTDGEENTLAADTTTINNTINISSGVEMLYVNKLIDVINDLSVSDSRKYVIELLSVRNISNSDLERISHQKLYYFMPQIKNKEFLFCKNPLLKAYSEGGKFFEELKDSFYAFDREIPLLGEFTVLRNRYDNIKLMEYIEDKEGEVFYVRSSDGSLSKIHLHRLINNKIYEENGDLYNNSKTYEENGKIYGDNKTYGEDNNNNSNNSNIAWNIYQFCNLPSTIIPSSLLKHGFNIPSLPVHFHNSSIAFSIHSIFDTSLHSISNNIKDCCDNSSSNNNIKDCCVNSSSNNNIKACCVNSYCDNSYNLRNYFISRFDSYNDYFFFKKNFILSYSSIISLQCLFENNSVSFKNLFVDLNGNITSLVDSNPGIFHLNPSLQRIFGPEGINGPLFFILNEVFNNFDCHENFRFFLRDKKIKKSENVNHLIGEMVDPIKKRDD